MEMEHLPNELKNRIKDYTIFKPITKEELQNAVDIWCEDREEATNQYGPTISMQCTCPLTAGQTVEVSTSGLSFHGANGYYFGGHLLG